VLERISQPEMLAHVQQMGGELQDSLRRLGKKSIREVRGLGLMVGVEIDGPAKTVLEKGYQEGLLLLSAGENVLRLLPPLIVSKHELDKFIQIIDKLLD
jgi:acetylornithine/N-succinyldiaminopimelate aminotransferase